MRIGIVVDSTCDLPSEYIQKHNVVLLPITVRIGDAVLADHRDEEATLSFLHAHVAERGHEAETVPYSVDQIRERFGTLALRRGSALPEARGEEESGEDPSERAPSRARERASMRAGPGPRSTRSSPTCWRRPRRSSPRWPRSTCSAPTTAGAPGPTRSARSSTAASTATC